VGGGLLIVVNGPQASVSYTYRLGRVVDNSVVKSANTSSIDEIRDFLSGDGAGPIAVASVPADIKSAIGANSDVVLLSRYTADKQAKHPEITAESFGWLQKMLDDGERLYDKKHHATVIFYREQPFIAVLKSASGGAEVYLQSFRRSDVKNILSLKNRGGG
jgi:hypothetical protein